MNWWLQKRERGWVSSGDGEGGKRDVKKGVINNKISFYKYNQNKSIN